MVLLCVGVGLWSAVHLVPSLAGAARAGLIARIGEQPYKGLFALSLVGAIALMVLGWRSSVSTVVYVGPTWGALVTNVLVFLGLVLFVASGVPTNIKRFLRHPQLTGVAVWAGAHLLSNGDLRSLVLFGGLGLWALVEMVCINRRDGVWVKPDPLPMTAELRPLVGAALAYVVLFFAHPWIAGVSPLPG